MVQALVVLIMSINCRVLCLNDYDFNMINNLITFPIFYW